jgi:hypothetical protein
VSPNPYAPPESPIEPPPAPAEVRLFGPAVIAAHAVLLAPLVGAILAAINHRRLGNAQALRRTLLLFVAPSALLLILAVAAPSGSARPLRYLFGIALAWMLFREHKPLVDKHLAAGGKKVRWYLLTLAIVGPPLLAAAVWTFLTPPDR